MATVGRWRLWTTMKLLVLTLIIVSGGSALIQDERPVHASHTVFHLSYNSNCLTYDVTVVIFVGGPPQNFYLCAKNVDNSPYGAAAFTLEMKYVSWLINVNSVDIAGSAYAGGWLGSTGRAVQCVPVTIDPSLENGQGRAYGGCQTVGLEPPNGPLGNAALAQFVITPGNIKGSTSLDFRGTVGEPTTATHLVSAYWEPGNPEVPFGSVIIPAYAPLVPMYIAPCADYIPLATGGDNVVAIQDIFYHAQQYGKNSSQPGWNPDWDMDGNNYVTIPDIFVGAKQFGRRCPT